MKCTDCRKVEAGIGKRVCVNCRPARIRDRRAYLRARYKRATKAKMCTHCYAVKALPGRSRCQSCADRETHRRLEAMSAGLCWSCRRYKAMRGALRCRRCLKQQRDYAATKEPPYVPIDEWLAMPSTRILRALRFHDWASSAEILDSIGADESQFNTIRTTLYRLYQVGKLERRACPHHRKAYEYRVASGVSITPPQDLSVCSDQEAA